MHHFVGRLIIYIASQLCGKDIESLRELKTRAFTLYARNRIEESEKIYFEILKRILELNDHNKCDPEYITGINNVNKCRQKRGQSLLDESGEEVESIDEW